MAQRRKSSILVNRKLSSDFARKLSAISVASDVSLISERFGMEQGELKTIVQDILEMNINDDFDVNINNHIVCDYSEELLDRKRGWVVRVWRRWCAGNLSLAGTSERDHQTRLQEIILQLRGKIETLHSSEVSESWSINTLNTFQASTDSLDSAEDFKPVEINLGEIKEMLSMYKKRRISTSALTGSQAKQTTI